MASASLLTLPLELKAKIVEMTGDQEAAWEMRTKLDPPAEHINSLSSLALVNKEFRDLAASRQFKVLSSTRASLPVFRYAILRKYANRIRSIDLASHSSTSDIEAAFLAVGHLPRLHTLSLSWSAAFSLFGPNLEHDPSDEGKAFRIDVLEAIAGQLETLVLSTFDPAEVVGLLHRFKFANLKRLAIIGLTTPDKPQDMHDLAAAIASLRQVRDLTITAGEDTGTGWWTVETLAPLARDPPPVRSLQLGWFDAPHEIPNIAQVFSSTLQTLSLQVEMGHEEQEADRAAITPIHLPHLTNLIVSPGRSSGIQHISRVFLSSAHLSQIMFDFVDEPPDLATESSPFLTFLASQPSLREVHLKTPAYTFPLFVPVNGCPSPSFLTAYADILDSRGLDRKVLDKPHLTPFHRKANLDYTDKEAGFLKRALRRTLEFGLGELDRMFAEGSVARGVSWVAKLKALEEERCIADVRHDDGVVQLPLELKARVVGMASDQEDAWKWRVKDAEERAGHINSLSSLALVNKELRDLAATHQFKRLSSKGTLLPVFRYSILRKYANRVTSLDFSPTTTIEELEATLLSMDRLPALRTLNFRRATAISLFGRGVTLKHDPANDLKTLGVEIFTSVGGQIDTLLLQDLKPSEIVTLLRVFPDVRTLALMNLKDPDHEDDIHKLAAAIALLRRLDSLTLDLGIATSRAPWSVEALAPLERNPPPIRTLQLGWFPFDHHIIFLAGLFSSSLQTLFLPLKPSDLSQAEPDLASITPVQLPRLTNLSISTYESSDIDHISRLLLSASTLTTFAFETFTDRELGPTSSSTRTLPFLSSQPTLRHVELGRPNFIFPLTMKSTDATPLAPPFLAAYAELVHSRGLHPSVLDQPHLSAFHPQAKLDYTENEAGYLEEVLGRTLDFGRIELKRMLAEGNVARAVGWVEKLRSLEEERLLWKD